MSRAPYPPALRAYVVDVNLSAAKLEAFYAGHVGAVSARSRDGVQLHFPLNALRRFVGHDGVRGSFVLQVDAANRLKHIKRI